MKVFLVIMSFLLFGTSYGQKAAIDSAIDSITVKNMEKYYNPDISDSLRNVYKAQISQMDKYILKDSLNMPLEESLRNEQDIFQSIVSSDNAIKKMREIQDRYFKGEKPKDIEY